MQGFTETSQNDKSAAIVQQEVAAVTMVNSKSKGRKGGRKYTRTPCFR
jgi:hypothetical protein